MESIMNKHMEAKIKANYRDARKRNAIILSKKSHGAKVLENNLFASIFGAICGFFRGIGKSISVLFRKAHGIRSWCVKTPYHYDGEPKVKGENGDRYGVYMRNRKRNKTRKIA